MGSLIKEIEDLATPSRSPSKTKPSIIYSNMGDFAKLPIEMREEIWHFVTVQNRESWADAGVEVRCCAILRTCQALFKEVSVHLYKEVLTFHINQPYCNLRISTTRNTRSWNLRPEDLENSTFRHLPYRRLQGVQIVIEVPGGDEQWVYQLWTMVNHLVDLLSNHDELPNIDIQLKGDDGNVGIWLLPGRTFLYYFVCGTVLIQFCRL